MAGVGSGLILSTCDIPNVVQTVLDTPMLARSHQQFVRPGLLVVIGTNVAPSSHHGQN
jgi:hypothetical protein